MNDKMREASGNVICTDRLVCFLYMLGRDNLPTGKIEEIMMQIENTIAEPIHFTNGWLAKWAIYTADRLTYKGE